MIYVTIEHIKVWKHRNFSKLSTNFISYISTMSFAGGVGASGPFDLCILIAIIFLVVSEK
jgi:hypothetical protein